MHSEKLSTRIFKDEYMHTDKKMRDLKNKH